jgi:hypothetical protein
MNLIQKFNKYFQSIQESLNSPEEIIWNITDNYILGEFVIDNYKYKIESKKQIGDNWSFSFYYLDGDDWSPINLEVPRWEFAL